MMDKKKTSFVEWYMAWEENIKGKPADEPNISLEEWNKMSPKEKTAFIRKNRSSLGSTNSLEIQEE